jgi:hypothetical protein
MVTIIMTNKIILKMRENDIFFVPLVIVIVMLTGYFGLNALGKKDMKLDMEVKVSEHLSGLRLTLVESEIKSKKLFQYYLGRNIKKELDGEGYSESIEIVLLEQQLANQKVLLLLSKLTGNNNDGKNGKQSTSGN